MVTTKKKPQKTSNSGKNVEKLEALHTADGIVKWCKLPLKKKWPGSSPKKQTKLPIAFPLLSIYPKELKVGLYTYPCSIHMQHYPQ